jgi:hypothetical protein
MRGAFPALLTAAAATVLAAAPADVTVARRATNLASLTAFPGFFHGRPIVALGRIVPENGSLRLTDDTHLMRVMFKGNAPEGLVEVRGDFWDIGRMNTDDPRLTPFDLKRDFGVDPEGSWPRQGEVTAIFASSITEARVPPAPSIRSIVLDPPRYAEQQVTVTGQFAGRNLFGDLPDSPAKSRYDFVIRQTDAAIWVSGAQPKGKGWSLSLDARIDTGRWLEVTGTVKRGRGLQWLEVTAEGLKLGKAPTEPVEAETVTIARGPAPEVLFSAPTQDETDVPLTTTVRIQFSRDLRPATIKNNIHVRYGAAGAELPAPEFTTNYNTANRVLEIKFTKPLEAFQHVTVELTDAILGTDDQALKPFTLGFDVAR